MPTFYQSIEGWFDFDGIYELALGRTAADPPVSWGSAPTRDAQSSTHLKARCIPEQAIYGPTSLKILRAPGCCPALHCIGASASRRRKLSRTSPLISSSPTSRTPRTPSARTSRPRGSRLADCWLGTPLPVSPASMTPPMISWRNMASAAPSEPAGTCGWSTNKQQGDASQRIKLGRAGGHGEKAFSASA